MPLSFLIVETKDIFGVGWNKTVATDVAVKNTFKKSTGYNKPYWTVLYYSQEKSLESLKTNIVTVSTDVAIKNTFKKSNNYNMKHHSSQ